MSWIADFSTHLNLRINLSLGENEIPENIDRIQIQQVLENLVRNAVEAMVGSPDREITVKLEADDPARARVSISDMGPGIDPAVAGSLFNPFTTTKEQGMGIGLSICKSIIESHEGEIGFQANSPRGTTFFFTVPVVARD